ncbi:hypothetical protein M0R45_015680 [Rubus argutus]|uniref:RNase H type-1 domain-containing protein n=1 Tax=Rubus argutus TaxID=59490 RepID=A0AAW1XSS2_RUBAR
MEAFNFLKERAQNKLQGWRENTLSAGKEILIKSVVQSIPTYLMSCFELPKQLCWDIQQLMAKFCLKARYYPNTTFLDAMVMPDMSFSWRSILTGRNILTNGMRFQIGSGNSVSLWKDPWLPLPYSFKPFSPPMDGTESWLVGDIIDHEKAEACRAGLLLAIHQGWDDLIMETDCAMLVDALTGVEDDFSQIGRIVGDCKEYLCSFNSFEIRHVYREANRVTHRLAHIASLSNFDNCWLRETPSIIEDVLFEDLCNLTRGFGITSPSMYLSSVS